MFPRVEIQLHSCPSSANSSDVLVVEGLNKYDCSTQGIVKVLWQEREQNKKKEQYED